MKNIDFKQLALTAVAVLVATAVYDRLIGPMLDKSAD